MTKNNQENHLIKKIKVQTMKPYPKYKDSGVEWIGEIPDRWLNLTLKRITTIHRQGYYTTESYIDNGVKLIRISDLDENGNINYRNMPFVKISDKDESVYQVKKGDFLFPRTGSIGLFGYVRKIERAVFASYLINFRFSQQVDGDFLKFYFLSNNFRNGIFRDLHGGVNQNVHAENIKNQTIVFPSSLEEQHQIAAYLDNKTSQIDTLIEKKKRLIELLKEERTAIINQAVTKGLDPNVPMKDSGIEWLGEIPEHWEVKKLKYIADANPSNVDKKSKDNEEEIFICNYLDVYKNEFIGSGLNFMKATATKSQIDKFILKKGDVIATKDSETPDDIAIPAFVLEDFDNVVCGYHLTHIKPLKIHGAYLFRYFQSKFLRSYFEISSNGITRFGIGVDEFNSALILIPTFREQQEIEIYLNRETSRIDAIITKSEKQIELFQEYRTALISEVVTGKVDVRDGRG
ncbi:MAG: restriction endonuclease subunit S [Desulfobacterales bacterium]|nr:restriction endonuclease subunit S [Desulfobacterales bacterium]